ncbi:MAG: CYTH domain-containing protein, partial [Gammaproteobacteria bacterium]|nr:CYTH domain-containing protein [Gammaproteobacteria bacterium]
MAMEIERKFLVAGDGWRTQVVRSRGYRQGYFPGMETASVRLRVSGDKAHLNIKSATLGITRQEYDYGIPLRDAEEMLATLCGSAVIEKTRYWVKFGHLTW